MFLVLEIVTGFIVVAYVVWWAVDRRMTGKRVAGILESDASRAGPASKEPAQESSILDSLDRVLSSRDWADRLLLKLMRAGLDLRPSEFVGITAGVSLALAILLAFTVHVPGIEILGLVIGIAGSRIYLDSRCAKRLAAFSMQLPDALSLISSAVRSGYSFERAAGLVCDEMPAPISEEFGRMLTETNNGRSLDDSLAHMVDRVGSYDLELVVVAVTVHRQVGGNLVEVLENISGTIRERVRVEAEVSTLTVEGRMSGVVLQILPLAVAGLILVMNPGYISVLTTEPLGRILVGAAVVLQIVGALMIRQLLKLDY